MNSSQYSYVLQLMRSYQRKFIYQRASAPIDEEEEGPEDEEEEEEEYEEEPSTPQYSLNEGSDSDHPSQERHRRRTSSRSTSDHGGTLSLITENDQDWSLSHDLQFQRTGAKLDKLDSTLAVVIAKQDNLEMKLHNVMRSVEDLKAMLSHDPRQGPSTPRKRHQSSSPSPASHISPSPVNERDHDPLLELYCHICTELLDRNSNIRVSFYA
jgi:hypothetical protein